MSLNRISFLEGWERTPAFLRRRDSASAHSGEDSDSYASLPETASELSSSFRSTYGRLNFNPYAGPAWNETADDHGDHPSLFGSLGLSPTTTRDSRVDRVDGVDTERSPTAGSAGNGAVAVKPLPDTKGAFEVSPAKRIAQVCLAVVYCFLAAGIVFGFAAIKPILIRENVYRNLCSKEELYHDVPVCDGQEIRLNLMFTIAAVATNVSALPVGTILDAYGPRVSGLIGSLCLTIGALLFAIASHLSFDGYIPGYLFLSLGGPFIFISSFHLSNTFPRRSGLILSSLTGAFDASSALFLFFRLLHEQADGYVTTQKFFLAYLFVPAFIAVVQITTMPAISYKTAGELVQQAETQLADEMNDRVDDTTHNGERERHDRRVHRQSIVREIQGLLDDSPTSIASTLGTNDSPPNPPTNHNRQTHNTTTDHPPNPLSKTPAKDSIYGILHGHSALKQLLTPWFTLITAFTILMMLRINYFISTLRTQYTHLLTPSHAETLNKTFDILLPTGGLLSIPFTGPILDTLRTRTILLTLVSLATLIGTLGCIRHNLPAAYSNIILFVIYRPFYYTAVSDYAAKVFGFATFGKVYGLIICLAGVGNFAQAGLDAITLMRFGGDPVPVNVLLTGVVVLVGGGLVVFVWWETGVLDRVRRVGDGEMRGEMRFSVGGCRGEGVLVRDWERWPLLREHDHRNRDTERRERYGSTV